MRCKHLHLRNVWVANTDLSNLWPQILFSSMACLQGHQKQGLQHLQSGIKLLNEVDEEEKYKAERHPIDVESLRTIFTGLDMQARSILSASGATAWESVSRIVEPTVLHIADLNDESLLTMQRHLHALLNRTMAFMQSSSSRPREEGKDVYRGYCRLLKRFDHGSALLQSLCAKAAYSKGNFAQPLLALQLLHSQLKYFMRWPRGDLEWKFAFMCEPFDEPFDPTMHFTEMLGLAENLLPDSFLLPPVYTTTSGPLQALWLIATRAPTDCLNVRKRAVELMGSYARREGFWDGLVAWKLAQEVLRLEQESAWKELGFSATPDYDLIVPADLRIVAVSLAYDEENERRASVGYKSVRDMAEGTPGRAQTVVW
jgi:hypothetical protein